jgi:hypothetical protein
MDDKHKDTNRIGVIGHYLAAFNAGILANIDEADITQTPVFPIYAPPKFDFNIPRQKTTRHGCRSQNRAKNKP